MEFWSICWKRVQKLVPLWYWSRCSSINSLTFKGSSLLPTTKSSHKMYFVWPFEAWSPAMKTESVQNRNIQHFFGVMMEFIPENSFLILSGERHATFTLASRDLRERSWTSNYRFELPWLSPQQIEWEVSYVQFSACEDHIKFPGGEIEYTVAIFFSYPGNYSKLISHPNGTRHYTLVASRLRVSTVS